MVELYEDRGNGSFIVMTVSYSDVTSTGCPMAKLNPLTMGRIAEKLADRLMEGAPYWDALKVVAEEVTEEGCDDAA